MRLDKKIHDGAIAVVVTYDFEAGSNEVLALASVPNDEYQQKSIRAILANAIEDNARDNKSGYSAMERARKAIAEFMWWVDEYDGFVDIGTDPEFPTVLTFNHPVGGFALILSGARYE